MLKPTLSIIIISYNTRDVTKNCLESIWEQTDQNTVPYEIIVVDNDSKDGSPEMLKDLASTHSDLVLLLNEENIGFGRGNNQAAKVAKGSFLFFLNSDTIVLDRAVEKLMGYYQEHESVVHLLGPKLFNQDMTPQPSVAPFLTPLMAFAALLLFGDRLGLTRWSPNQIKEVGWIHGAAMLMKKEYFNRLNGFDQDIFMYMEEVDLCYRAKQAGLTRYFYPNAHIIHLGGTSSQGRTNPILNIFRGYLWFYKKHYSPLAIFLLRFMLKLKAAGGYLVGVLTNNAYLKKTYAQAFTIS